jgi:hypothetical protein
MQQCLIHDNSLRFSRAVYGVLLIVAYYFRSEWLLLAVTVLTILGAFTLKLNIPYQLHSYVKKLIHKEAHVPTQRDLGEINFVAGATGVLLAIGYLFLYFNKYQDFAWIYVLVVAFMIFLACFVGFCIATLMYVFFRKLLDKNSTNSKA